MKKEIAKKHIEDNMNEGDLLIGFFQALTQPNIFFILFIGPIYLLTIRKYFVGVTQNENSLHKISFIEKFKEHDFFRYNEIESVKIGKGLLYRSMKFTFKNGRKINLKAHLRCVDAIAKITPDVQTYIENNIMSLK